MSLFALCFAASALMLLGLAYLGKLPEAPLCPSCRGMTGESERFWPGGRALSHLSTTVVRQCAVCGWHGRMRWKPSAPRVRAKR